MNVAAVDIGTNSMRLLIVDADGDEIIREVHVTGLGSGVDATRRFDPDRVQETLDVMERFGRLIHELDVRVVAAVATSATRDASNGTEFVDEVYERLGHRPEIISGDREAKLAFAGATAGRPKQPTVVVDIGGGSTEIAIGSERPEQSVSIDIGSVRLTDRLLRTRPVASDELGMAVDHVMSLLQLPSHARGIDVCGVGGTFATIAAVKLGYAGQDLRVVDGTRVRVAEIDEMVLHLARLTIDQTANIPGIHPRRAAGILAGAVIAKCALTSVDAQHVTVRVAGLLDALAAEALQTALEQSGS